MPAQRLIGRSPRETIVIGACGLLYNSEPISESDTLGFRCGGSG